MLAIELRHALVFGLLEFFVTGALLFFASGFRDSEIVEVMLFGVIDVFRAQDQGVILGREFDVLAAGDDLMTTVLVVPLGQRGGHVHFLDNVAPAAAGVVSAERNLAFLRRVGDDALLGAAEIVIEQVLEPRSGHEQELPAATRNMLNTYCRRQGLSRRHVGERLILTGRLPDRNTGTSSLTRRVWFFNQERLRSITVVLAILCISELLCSCVENVTLRSHVPCVNDKAIF